MQWSVCWAWFTGGDTSANSQDSPRLDVSANGVWCGRFQKTYFDVRVFNPLAPSNRNPAPTAVYRKHELEKKRAYQQWIKEVEHSSFTPLVLSATGGMGNEATIFYKCLASLLTQKWDFPYSTTLCWLRCRLSYTLFFAHPSKQSEVPDPLRDMQWDHQCPSTLLPLNHTS